MPFPRPTLPELNQRIQSDTDGRLDGADARLAGSNLNVLARVDAGVAHGLHGHIEHVSKQILPDTAETEVLDRQGSIWAIPRKQPTAATGAVTVTGTDGTVVPAGTVLQRADEVRYQTTAETTVEAGTVSLDLVAEATGQTGNAAAGVTLTLVNPIVGLATSGQVTAGALTGGTDIETDNELRQRIITRIQQPPHGGADFDYVAWTLAQPGVTRAWVYPQELGLGTVSVRFMMDDTYANGIPLAEDVAAVQTALDDLRPVTADLTVVAPVPIALDVEISGLNPSTEAVRLAVEAEIADLIRREATPASTILISRLREAISLAAGEYDHGLVSPVANVTHTTGQIAVPGAITWS
ncbi:MAG: baseplate J/gp47 family protein [Magnetovibrionaceae bacterium]